MMKLTLLVAAPLVLAATLAGCGNSSVPISASQQMASYAASNGTPAPAAATPAPVPASSSAVRPMTDLLDTSGVTKRDRASYDLTWAATPDNKKESLCKKWRTSDDDNRAFFIAYNDKSDEERLMLVDGLNRHCLGGSGDKASSDALHQAATTLLNEQWSGYSKANRKAQCDVWNAISHKNFIDSMISLVEESKKQTMEASQRAFLASEVEGFYDSKCQ